MTKIEGNPDNCKGCYFKAKLLGGEPYCRRIGEEIFTVDNCVTGPLIQSAGLTRRKVSTVVLGRRNWGTDFRLKRALDNI